MEETSGAVLNRDGYSVSPTGRWGKGSGGKESHIGHQAWADFPRGSLIMGPNLMEIMWLMRQSMEVVSWALSHFTGGGCTKLSPYPGAGNHDSKLAPLISPGSTGRIPLGDDGEQ